MRAALGLLLLPACFDFGSALIQTAGSHTNEERRHLVLAAEQLVKRLLALSKVDEPAHAPPSRQVHQSSEPLWSLRLVRHGATLTPGARTAWRWVAERPIRREGS